MRTLFMQKIFTVYIRHLFIVKHVVYDAVRSNSAVHSL
jgi:hypothetical protein